MQFRDLQRQYQALRAEMDHAVCAVMASGSYVLGQQVETLELRLASYVGVEHCVSCGSGTDALYLALRVWGVGPGDAVFVPDFTFFASAEVVSLVGAEPVFVDVEEDTFNISPTDLEQKIAVVAAEGRLRPRVIMAVDLFGLPANYAMVRHIADSNNLLVLEDGAQGFGGRICDKKACSFGDIATTSFFPAKPLGCYGDGGALFTCNADWAAMARSLRVHGRGTDKYCNVSVGINSRLDALQAAVLNVKLDAFDQELEAVNNIAKNYSLHLQQVVECPSMPKSFYSSWAQYTIRLRDRISREALMAGLAQCQIPTQVYYPIPLHLLPVYAGGSSADCPTACQLSDMVLSLPMHPYLSEEEVRSTIYNIINIINNNE